MERTYECHLAALAAAERIPDTAEAAEAFSHHGPVAAGIFPERARRFARRAIRVCREHGHVACEMQARFMAGMMFVFQARWSEALEHFGEAIALYPKVGDVSTLETAHENLAYAHLYRGDLESAVVHAERALSLSEQVGDRRGVTTSLHHLATAELRLGHVERADRLSRDGLASLAALHDDNVHVMTHALAARVARAKGSHAEAARAIARAVQIAAPLVQEETTYAHWELAEIFLDLEAQARGLRPGARRAAAMRALGKARRLARRFPAHEGPVLRVTARVLAADGEIERARVLVLRAAQVLADRGMRYELGRTWEAAAALLPGDRAALARDRACRLYGELGAALDAERARTTQNG
jgi:tetratricopeptide (TPR) repeat protein